MRLFVLPVLLMIFVCWLVVEFNGCGLGTFIYQVDYGHIRNTELVVSPISQVRLLEYPMPTPAASIWGGVAQGVCVQFGICEAAVAGKAAAAYFFGHDDFG